VRLVVPIALLGGVTALLAGCYGSTEPASDIGPESATLNARGTADEDGVTTKFEYGLTGRVGDPLEVGAGHFSAGASGPFSAKVAHLAAGSNYSFRMCGRDDGEADYVCAQPGTFRTQPPVEDSVYGEWADAGGSSFSVDAHSGPEGQSPHGTISWRDGDRTYTSDEVTCMIVDGPRAILGSVGILHTEPSGVDDLTSTLVTVVDGRTQEDTLNYVSPTNVNFCSQASFDDQRPLGSQFEFVVNDAVVLPTR
jgi:hypothetical protein